MIEAFELIEGAASPGVLFPDLGKAKDEYRRLARLVHPDRAEPKMRLRAERVFAKLSDWYAQRTGATTAARRIGDWTVHGGIAKGSICDVHQVSGRDISAVLKVARHPRDNKLLSQEAAVLKVLQKKLPDPLKIYIPKLHDSMKIGGRRANVIDLAEGCLTLDSIRRQMPPAPAFEHVVWMGNRIWEILGEVQQLGIVHGAILPHHLMYRPSDHGLVLIDWSCSLSDDGYIPLIVKRWEWNYPPEVKKKSRISGATDIYMAAAALRIAAGRIPRRFRAILDWAMAESPASRPSHAWDVSDRWRKAAEEEYGKPKFVELKLPTN